MTKTNDVVIGIDTQGRWYRLIITKIIDDDGHERIIHVKIPNIPYNKMPTERERMQGEVDGNDPQPF